MQKIIFLTRTTQSWCRSKKYVKGLLGNHKTNTRINTLYQSGSARQGVKNYVDNIWVKSKAQITN